MAAAKYANPSRLSIMHASLSGSGTHSDGSLERLAAVGVIPVVSAGHKRSDACAHTPVPSRNTITVANSDKDDCLWW